MDVTFPLQRYNLKIRKESKLQHWCVWSAQNAFAVQLLLRPRVCVSFYLQYVVFSGHGIFKFRKKGVDYPAVCRGCFTFAICMCIGQVCRQSWTITFGSKNANNVIKCDTLFFTGSGIRLEFCVPLFSCTYDWTLKVHRA